MSSTEIRLKFGIKFQNKPDMQRKHCSFVCLVRPFHFLMAEVNVLKIINRLSELRVRDNQYSRKGKNTSSSSVLH